jgi:protein ImuB
VAVRSLAVWCPDWPVAAAGHGPDRPVAVVADGRVVACSEAAWAEGVAVGLRKRQAESRCSDLLVVDADPARDARAFEPVVAAVETAAPAVQVCEPGLCALPARGPARYYGSERAAVSWVTQAVEGALGPARCRVGIADGLWPACQAARTGTIVPAGRTPAFLSELPVEVLVEPDLADRFRRLGLRTLGDVAALPSAAMVERFGHDGARAHRLARGVDERPLLPRVPPPDLAVAMGFDPPADRLDVVLFAARQLAGELAGRLEEAVLGCTLLAIEAETAGGRTLVRRWRHEDGLTPQALADRVRWQVEAWLLRGGPAAGASEGSAAGSPDGSPAGSASPGPPGAAEHDGPPIASLGGFARLRLVPELVHPERGRQLGFWGERPADRRAAGALTRLQGMLGLEAVYIATLGGGRGPADRVRLVPWADTVGAAEPGTMPGKSGSKAERPSWPGRIPAPSPATVHWNPAYPAHPTHPAAVAVLDASGAPVSIDGRGQTSGDPASLRLPGTGRAAVLAWAGPWPTDERWWDPPARRRRVRLQVLTDAGSAHLLAFDQDRWLLEATYD